VQRVTKGIGPEFKNIELVLARTVLPTRFGDVYDEDNPHCKISCLPVKCAGLAIPDPTSLPESNHMAIIAKVKAELKLHNQAKNESVMISHAGKHFL
jgi:hypothetical protein